MISRMEVNDYSKSTHYDDEKSYGSPLISTEYYSNKKVALEPLPR